MTAPATHLAERERLRAAIVRMAGLFVARDATAQQLTTWAEVVETYTAGIEADPPNSIIWGIGSRGMFGAKGLLTPAGFAAAPARGGDLVQATLTFGPDQEGHRGLAHGGSIAQAFDYLLGMFETGGDGKVFTRELTVRFLRPVPIGRAVVLRARIDSTDGPSRAVSGELPLEGEVHSEATGVLVVKAT